MDIDREEDYYDLLGVAPRSTPAELKQAYRALARKYHPDADASQDHDDLFRKITQAFKVLSDPEKRNEYNKKHGYDYTETSDFERQEELRQAAAAAKEKRVEVAAGVDLGKMARDRAESAQDDLKLGHKIVLAPEDEEEEKHRGKDEEDFTPWGDEKAASDIAGADGQRGFFSGLMNRLGVRGKKNRAAEKERLRRQLDEASQPLQRSDSQLRKKTSAAPRQNLNSESVDDPFRGERVYHFQISEIESVLGTSREVGVVSGRDQTSKVRVKIPAGIASGTVLQIARGWDRTKVRITVAEDSFSRLDGRDVIVSLPVTLGEAINGGKIEVPTIEGHSVVQIPAGADTSQAIRLTGLGLQGKDGSEKGDQLVEIYIAVPRAASAALHQAVEAFSAGYREHVRQSNANLENWRLYGARYLLRLPVTLREAAIGAEIKLATP
ncbi:MAG TPA: DnaJ domain-containing protein, partial [Oligoflexia bacterium]|nr:DnaJ domain-containing protein [Oligoflexia bacterium]